KTQEEIEALIAEHNEDKGRRILQKALAEEITVRVHSQEEFERALDASSILFGKNTADKLLALDEQLLLDIMENVPQFEVPMSIAKEGSDAIMLLAEHTDIVPSKAEARRSLKGNAISVNKEKINDSFQLDNTMLIKGKYLLVQKGKKNYFLLKFI
ncbi:MAG: tyrosine--tRNA ligase, partial [Flavobacteriales bacterium]